MHKLVLLTALGVPSLFAQAAADITDLKWMAGHWAGPLGRARVEEHWTTPLAGLMLGVGRTTKGDRLLEFEFQRIERRPEGIFYVAQPGGRPPVEFRLTKSGVNSVTFENPKHGHPKVIAYRLEGKDVLVAAIEGDEGGKHKKQEFHLHRLSEGSSPANTDQ